jgi:predicted metal-dependent hydrolase
LEGLTVTEPGLEAPPDGLRTGVEEFNRGEFFECHETLEELWMADRRPIRRLYQGILQIGVAFHHLRAGRHRPVVTLLKRGSNYLEPFAPLCMGVDVSALLSGAARCLAEVERLGAGGLNDFDWSLVPKIEIREQSAKHKGMENRASK